MHHLGFPFRCTFCLSHVPRKGKKLIMENASNICWHNCCLSNSPPLPFSLSWLLSPHTFPRRICFVIRSIAEFTILWGVSRADSLLTAASWKSYAMFAKENHKNTNTKRSWSDISQGEFTKNMGQCSGANFASFCIFCANITVSQFWLCLSSHFPLTTLALGLGHATAAVYLTSSRELAVFFCVMFCFSSYIIGKWQCQKLVAFPICHSLLPVASCQLLCATNAALTILENSFVLVIDKWEASGTVSTFLHFYISTFLISWQRWEPLAANCKWLTLMAADDKRNFHWEMQASTAPEF